MKIIIKYMLPLFIGGMLSNTLKAQTEVKLLDFSIIRNFKQAPNSTPADSVELMVQFKINKADQASKAHLWLGSAKDNSDILIAEPVFNTTAGKSYIVYNNVRTEVKNYQALFYVKMSSAVYTNFSAATLFVETTNGQNTARLYYTK